MKAVYARRDLCAAQVGTRLIGLGDLFMLQQRQKAVVDALRRAGFDRFGGIRLLDLGCGDGGPLSRLLTIGVPAQALFGVDILMSKLKWASTTCPCLHWVCADGQSLPLDSACFNLIIQFTAFSSVLDIGVRKRMASEMLRVLKKEGAILWFDFFFNNPHNPNVRGIGKAEVCSLFPDCHIKFRRVILAPPLARALAPWSWLLCSGLAALRLFNTHYLALIRPKG